MAQTTGMPHRGRYAPQDRSLFCFESFCARAVHSLPPRALPASRTSGGPAPAAKYIDIDAFNGKTVTLRNLGKLHG